MKRGYFLLLVLLLTGCTESSKLSIDNESSENNTSSNEAFTSSEVAAEYRNAFENANEMQLFMYEDLSTLSFEGTGNEYASYVVKTNWLSNDFVRQIVDNGARSCRAITVLLMMALH